MQLRTDGADITFERNHLLQLALKQSRALTVCYHKHIFYLLTDSLQAFVCLSLRLQSRNGALWARQEKQARSLEKVQRSHKGLVPLFELLSAPANVS